MFLRKMTTNTEITQKSALLTVLYDLQLSKKHRGCSSFLFRKKQHHHHHPFIRAPGNSGNSKEKILCKCDVSRYRKDTLHGSSEKFVSLVGHLPTGFQLIHSEVPKSPKF